MRATLPLSLLVSSLLSLPLTTSTPVSSTLISREIKAGEHSTLTVTTFYGKGCQDKKQDFPNVIYSDNQSLGSTGMQSYHLSRALDPSEQLDFSTAGMVEGTAWVNGQPSEDYSECGKFLECAPTGQKEGCHDIQKWGQCFKLWHH